MLATLFQKLSSSLAGIPTANIVCMMTSSDGNIFRVTGPLWGEFTGHRWIPSQGPVARSFAAFFDLRLHKRLSNNRGAGILRHHHAHYDVTVMVMHFLISRWPISRCWGLHKQWLENVVFTKHPNCARLISRVIEVCHAWVTRSWLFMYCPA